MCTNFKATAETIATEGISSIESVLTILDPTWPGLPKFKTDAAAVLAAIQGWTPGTTAENIVQVITILIDDVNLIPVPPEYQAVIVVALNGLKSVIVLLEQHSGNPPTVAAAMKAMEAPDWVAPTKVYTGAFPYARDWNRVVGSYPNLSTAKISNPGRFLVA